MNSQKMTNEQAEAIGRAAGASGLKPEDVAFMSKQPPKQAKQAKQQPTPSEAAKPKPVSEPMPTVPSDSELLSKKADYDKGRSLWARGDMNAQELETLYASYMRARAVYSSQQSLYGARLPPENPLPKIDRDLETAKLERDDLQTKLREAKQEESKLKKERASSPDVRIAALAAEALKILQEPGDSRSIPAIAAKALKAEERVKTLENQMRVARRET